MTHTNQHYFSVEKLQNLITKFSGASPVSGKDLKGFVFVQGFNPGGQSRIYAYPVFGDKSKNPADGDLMLQNFDEATSACPYPPGCK
jgi:hypothetical protein